MDRRNFAAGLLAGLAGLVPNLVRAGPVRVAEREGASSFAALERRAGGRLGAFVLDAATGRSLGWRADERFGLCSTFKLGLAACVLARIDDGRLRPDEVLPYRAADLLPNSPVTGAHAGAGGMTVLALAEAAQTVSDNLAANLLLRRIGGPAALTRWWRSLGDRVTRLDRYEPGLNFVPAGEVRDTSTPRATAYAVSRIFSTRVLKPDSRERLLGWMVGTRTGLARIRAGLPDGWHAGDKTGTAMRQGMGNMVNDIAFAYPPGAPGPLVIVGFFRAAGHSPEVETAHEAALRELGRVAAAWHDAA